MAIVIRDGQPTGEVDWLVCSCCGKGIRDNAQENTHFGKVPYPDDTGFGMCVECGGDKKLTGTDEASIRKRLGWGMETFYDARIDVLNKNLTGPRLERFRRMSYAKKIVVITRLVEKGAMI